MKIPKPKGEVTCLGDRWALETWQYANEIATKYAKSKLEKLLLFCVIPTGDKLGDWWNITKKDLDLFRKAVRLLRKKTPYMQVVESVSFRAPLLKPNLIPALEYLAYRFDNEAFNQKMMAGYGFFGLSKADQVDRAKRYGERLEERFKNHELSVIKKP